MNDDTILFPLACGCSVEFYLQNEAGLIEYTYNLKKYRYNKKTIGKFYIYHIKIIEDIAGRFETLYNLIYVNLWSGRKEKIKNKTFEETVDAIRETKLISAKDSIEDFLKYFLFYMPKITINDVPVVVREKIDFKKERLPIKKI